MTTLCTFILSCCGYEHLYNHLRIASQPAKSKILIMGPLYKRKCLLTFTTDFQFIKWRKSCMGSKPNRGTIQD